MNLWPNDPSGSSPAAAWFRKLLAAARQCTPLSIEGFSIERTSSGFNARKNTQPTAGGKKGTTIDANYKLMAITGLGSALTPANPDLLVCREYSLVGGAVSSGVDVYVAKDSEARQIVSKEYYPDGGENVTVNYTYFGRKSEDSSYGDNFRLANDGLNSELQVMDKRYITVAQLQGLSPPFPLTQAVVWVVDTGSPTGVKDPAGANVTRLEVKPSRLWVRYATQ